jgi:hypothetical protein
MADSHRQMLKVMISSTAYDLPVHRQQVMDACIQQEMYPRAMEHLPASDADAIHTSLDMVDQADVYLGLIGFRYGYVPAGHTISLTEMEYNHAVKRGIKCLIFLMHKDHPLKETDVEKGEGAAKLETFKHRLTHAHVCKYFTSPDDLRAHVVNALSQFHRMPLQEATISYPWLETNSWVLGEDNKRKELWLQVKVREKPATSDAPPRIATVSSLQNLKLEVWMPVAVAETGWHECQICKAEVAEWNNHFSKPFRLIEIKSNTTVLVMVSSSTNAFWSSTVVLYKRGNQVDWEKYLEGVVRTPQSEQIVMVGEEYQNGVTMYTEGKRIILTPELLMQLGIPKVNSNPAKALEELCPKNSTRRYIEARGNLRIVLTPFNP